jgi:hypothetical protein
MSKAQSVASLAMILNPKIVTARTKCKSNPLRRLHYSKILSSREKKGRKVGKVPFIYTC